MLLRSKILSNFGLVAAIAVAVGTVGYFGISKTAGLLDQTTNELIPGISSLGDIQLGIAQARSAQNLLLISSLTPEQRETRIQNAKAAVELIDSGSKAFAALAKTAPETEQWNACQLALATFKANSEAFAARRHEMDKLIAENKPEELAAFQAEFQQDHLAQKAKDYRAAIALAEKLIKNKAQEAAAARSQAASTESSAKFAIFAGVAIGAALACGLGFWLASNIISSVAPLAARAKQIAAGDLSGQPLTVHSPDEIGQTVASMNQMNKSLRDLVKNVASSAGQVASAATQIAASSDQAATGANSQSQQIQQIAAAVEQLSSTVGEVNRKSNEAAENARKSGELAETGGRVVERTIADMQQIDEVVTSTAGSVRGLGAKSEQIGKIISVINDIAEQTNLLALNAAIEAARAGEHGRGFAVVADEVRKLADRTTSATAEVGQSIEAIRAETDKAVGQIGEGTEKVKAGVQRAGEAGSNLAQIVASAREVSGMVQSIAAAATQQGAATEEISRSISNISQISDQAASGSKQSAQAVKQLSAKSEELRALVSRFRL